MSNPSAIIPLVLVCTGNTAITPMTEVHGGRNFRASGLDAGGRITLGTATTADVNIKDATGKVLYNGTVISATDIAPTAAGVTGPINVTLTNVSNSSTGTVTINWWIKK